MLNNLRLLAFTALFSISCAAYASEEHGHDHGDEHGHEESSDKTEISDAAAEASGISISVAGAATIKDTVSLNGRVVLNQNRTALVKARFPGIVRSVKKAQGEMVTEGEVLATVESNESLQVYSVKSPLSGMILSRNSNIGDTAADAPMFTIADMRELWVELHVFPQEAAKVKAGEAVTLSSTECGDVQTTTITALLPITEASTQTLLARATVKNLDSHWLPGMSVNADVVIDTHEVLLAVKTSAIQRMENQSVIYVKEGGHYEARPVVLGAADKEWTEVKSGVTAGEAYVSEGSFIVKADIGKAGAAHEH